MRFLVRFFGFLFTAGTVVFLLGVAAVAGAIWHFSRDLPDYSQLQDYEPPVMTRVHASDGALLGEYSKERRLYLPIQAVPKLVINAFLAAEDKNFYEHGGISPLGIGRALVNNVTGGSTQGGSTITQQLVKQFEPRPRTFVAKAVEAAKARHMASIELLQQALALSSWVWPTLGRIFSPRWLPGSRSSSSQPPATR